LTKRMLTAILKNTVGVPECRNEEGGAQIVQGGVYTGTIKRRNTG